MNINNITLTTIIAFLCIQLFIFRPALNKKDSVTNSFIKASQEYIKKIEVRGEKRIVIIGNGPIFNEEGEALPFQDSAIIDPLREKLARDNYTVVTMSLPCLEPECNSHYFNLGLAALSLNPEAIILHAISSGLNTDTLDQLFTESETPVYVYGRELPINYRLYVGPDNNRLGLNLAEGILPEIEPGDNILYVETVRLINGDISDNGFARINSARRLLNKAGANEVDTLFTYWSKTNTYEQVNAILAQGKKVDYIITPSVETAEGAIEAVRQRNLQDEIKILSLDFNPRIKELIEEGSLYATTSQEFHRQSSALAAAIESQIESEITITPGSKKRFASSLITKDNLNNFIDDEGNYLY